MKDRVASITRTAACWLAAFALLHVSLGTAWSQNLQDRGIGGTGMMPEDQESDRGIGGTGVIGTIRGFGSIVVNNLHVTYRPDVPVQFDGQPRTVSDLKVGQVVRVVAENRNGVLATGQIDVVSEVVGTVEATRGTSLRVLGQDVSTEKLSGSVQWQRGDHVAVFGLRRPDGTIVASLIERRTGSSDRVAGKMVKRRDGSFWVGRLRLAGVDPALAGSRVVLEGRYRVGVLEVARAAKERDLLSPRVRRFSIEAYVQRTPNGLRLGSGLEMAGRISSALPAGSYAPAIVTAVSDRAGRLGVEALSLEGAPVRSNETPHGSNAGNSPAAPGRRASPHDRRPASIEPGPNDSSPGAAHGRSTGGSGGGRNGGRGGGSDQGGGGHGGGHAGDGNGGSAGGNGGGPGGGNGAGGGGHGDGGGNGGGGGGHGGGR